MAGVGSSAEFNVGVASATVDKAGSVGSGVWVAVGWASPGASAQPARKTRSKIMKTAHKRHCLEIRLNTGMSRKRPYQVI
jgi:hypothetical protein